MKLFSQKRFTFIGKSLLWSLLLYVSMMVVFNWDDVRNTVSGGNNITVVKPAVPGDEAQGIIYTLPVAPSIALRPGAARVMVGVIKTICGMAGHVPQ